MTFARLSRARGGAVSGPNLPTEQCPFLVHERTLINVRLRRARTLAPIHELGVRKGEPSELGGVLG